MGPRAWNHTLLYNIAVPCWLRVHLVHARELGLHVVQCAACGVRGLSHRWIKARQAFPRLHEFSAICPNPKWTRPALKGCKTQTSPAGHRKSPQIISCLYLYLNIGSYQMNCKTLRFPSLFMLLWLHILCLSQNILSSKTSCLKPTLISRRSQAFHPPGESPLFSKHVEIASVFCAPRCNLCVSLLAVRFLFALLLASLLYHPLHYHLHSLILLSLVLFFLKNKNYLFVFTALIGPWNY